MEVHRSKLNEFQISRKLRKQDRDPANKVDPESSYYLGTSGTSIQLLDCIIVNATRCQIIHQAVASRSGLESLHVNCLLKLCHVVVVCILFVVIVICCCCCNKTKTSKRRGKYMNLYRRVYLLQLYFRPFKKIIKIDRHESFRPQVKIT